MSDEFPTIPLQLHSEDPLLDVVWAAVLTVQALEEIGDPSQHVCWGWLRRSVADLGEVDYDPLTGFMRIEHAMAAEHPDR
jgi:hypothetical protein